MIKIEKYLKEFLHRIKYQFSKMKTAMVNTHNFCLDHNVYRLTGREVATILLNGFFIWIMLIPVLKYNPIWFIPSYGIVPWFVVNFIREIKQ